ncbi:MAG: PQQ-binding-like beta-propeller repeat protein [Solirubrobacterales bacterium]
MTNFFKNRWAIAVAGLAGLVALAGCGGGSDQSTTSTAAAPPSPPSAEGTDWPTYGFDPGRTRYLPSDTVKPPYQVAWRYNAGALMEYSPIVVRHTLYGIDNAGRAFAIKTTTHKSRWRTDVATLNASSPTYSDGFLYISNLEPGQVQALNARSGKVVWRHPLPGRTESSPLVVGDEVIAGCECGSVYGLDKRTGKELWSTPVGGAVKASPAYGDGIVYVGDYSGQMTALRASNGDVKWTAHAGGSIYGTAAVAFGRVYAGDLSGGFHAWDQQTGSDDWSTSTSGYVYSAATAAKTKDTPPSVYFGSYDGTVYALDARTGSQRWSRYLNGPVSGAGSMVGDVFYAGDLKTTETYGMRASDGKVVFHARDGAYNPAISDGRRLYLTGYKVIYSLHPAKGRSNNGFVKKSRSLAG